MVQHKDAASEDGADANRSETAPDVPMIRSDDLLRGGRELRIVHDREVYRLILTRDNRLILHK